VCQNIKTQEKNNFKICEKVVYDICMIKQKCFLIKLLK
jgi:hypothetical protein